VIYPLQVKNLKKTYNPGRPREVHAVRGVTFNVEPGEIFGLLGPNGAGKTTVISTITTLEKPTSGDVVVFGDSVLSKSDITKFKIGIVPQELIAQGFFNLVEILRFHSGYYGIWRNEERIEYLLKRLQLWEHRDKQVKQLSGGMKRRMMIAKALVHSPKLLLLDEPTAGVDVELRKSLWEFVLELRAQGVSILLTTHYLEEAEVLCDRVGIINNGELQFLGDTKKIIQDLTVRRVDITLRGQAPLQYEIASGVSIGTLLHDKKIDLSSIQDIKVREGTLEEAFLSVLRGGSVSGGGQ
jgi:ABC-2 type transport system ATP-binding protein